jgi:fibro-slime domain-containing protein
MILQRSAACAFVLLLAASTGCGADRGDEGNGTGQGSNKGSGGKGGASGFTFDIPDGSANGTNGGLGGNGSGTGENSNCEPNLTGIVRDFTPKHADFESYSGSGASKGIVKNELGADRKPVYAHMGAFTDPKNGKQVTSKETYDQWYRDTDGVNMRIEHRLMLTKKADGISSFDSNAFFPADGKGFGDFGASGHNFHFTFELHTEFVYQGGEVFTFKGDDDLWVFINGKLALDLGGLHSSVEQSVNLDMIAATFGLAKNGKYNLELFHAERHTNQSNFRIDTNINFTNCDAIIID